MLIVLGVILIVCLTGCSFWGDTDDSEMDLTQEEIDSAKNTSQPSVSGTGISAIKTVSIYTIDGINSELVPLRIPTGSQRITPEFIANEVVDNLDEKIEISEITVEDDLIYISFGDSYAPMKKCSKKFETLILDCVSNSILDNIPYVDHVIFRGENGAYKSDNYHFGLDEIYCSR